MKLNGDTGEGVKVGGADADAALMPWLDLASIACGGHTGDALSMARTVELAARHGVQVGAHPSYPDREGFGRRDIDIAPDALAASLIEQVRALEAVCESRGMELACVKPHGALYNRMMRDDATLGVVLAAVAEHGAGLPLVVQAGSPEANAVVRGKAAKFGVEPWFEAFADRSYLADGRLAPRTMPGAVHAALALVLEQAGSLIERGRVATLDGGELRIEAGTLCLHGDNPLCIEAAPRLREMLPNR